MKQDKQELMEARAFFEAIGIQCYDIIPPIDSDIYCVKRTDSQWAALRIRNEQFVVPFGRYNHMWGYDRGYCLVSVNDEDKTTFANRGIIDSYGKEVIKPYTYKDIFAFYGKGASYIRIIDPKGVPINIPITLLRLL